MTEFRLHGLGGQGIVLFSHMISQAALVNNLYCQSLPSFGVERRGASVSASVRIDDKPIVVHSQSYQPDYVIIMTESQKERAVLMGIKQDTKFIINSEMEQSILPGCSLNATQIALDNDLVHDNIPYINIPMFGAVCRVINFSSETVENVLRGMWKGSIADLNVKVALSAYDNLNISHELTYI